MSIFNNLYSLFSYRKKEPKRCPHNRVQDYTECCLDCGKNIYASDDDNDPLIQEIRALRRDIADSKKEPFKVTWTYDPDRDGPW